jgi:hypothetical protein
MSSRNMCLLPRATLHSDSEQVCSEIRSFYTELSKTGVVLKGPWLDFISKTGVVWNDPGLDFISKTGVVWNDPGLDFIYKTGCLKWPWSRFYI